MQRATKLGAVALAATLALAGAAAPNAAADLSSVRYTAGVVVNQGDVVEVGITKCQVGYVAAAPRRGPV